MKNHTILCVLSILLFASTSQALAATLLLHGGHILQGEVSQVEGVYHVKTDTGEIRIAVNRVERIFDTIEDIYRWKRTLIRVGSHSDHIQLAKWCLKFELLDLAQRELVAAELAESGTPMVDYLQRRLTAKRKAQTETHTKTTREPQLLAPSPTAKSFPPAPSPMVQPEASTTIETLEKVVRSISPRSMAQFSRTIQPILLNNCATGGCHVGTGREKMRLNRNGLTGKAGRRVTQRNLQAAMEWITPNRPDYSPLVTIPLHPHGKRARAMVDGHREEYRRLVYWVMQVSREQKGRRITQKFGGDNLIQPTMHTEPIRSKNRSGKSILRETLDLIPPEGANLQKMGKDGHLEPLYPSDAVTSTTPFRKALAINPSMLKKFVKEEDRKN